MCAVLMKVATRKLHGTMAADKRPVSNLPADSSTSPLPTPRNLAACMACPCKARRASLLRCSAVGSRLVSTVGVRMA